MTIEEEVRKMRYRQSLKEAVAILQSVPVPVGTDTHNYDLRHEIARLNGVYNTYST